MEKKEFDFLLHETLRDFDSLRKAKQQDPTLVDDYVLSQLDQIKLKISLIIGDNV